MTDRKRAPTFDELLLDLETVRRRGLGRIRSLHLPALESSVVVSDFYDEASSASAEITLLLRSAASTLGGGSLQDAAEYSLGLTPGTALWSAAERRERAADEFGASVETFRKRHERELLGQVADAILVLCQQGRMRQANVALQERRHPADSRLAVQWIERFEAYNRMWTPAWALAADLEAAISTYQEEPSEYAPWDPDGEPTYDRDEQARAYGRSALFRLTSFWLQLKGFMAQHGGMWLFSDPQVEEDVSDAAYRIGWHNPLTAEDESFLRQHLADARHQEATHFWAIVQSLPMGVNIEQKWQKMILDGVDASTEREKAASQVWLTISACHDYCNLVDDDWLKIADWYRPGVTPRKTVTGATLFDDLLRSQRQLREQSSD